MDIILFSQFLAEQAPAFDWSVMLQLLLETMITVFVPLIAAFGIQFFRAKIAQVRGQIPADQLALADQVITQFVKAAEQTGLTDELMREGSAKKAMVLQLAETELGRHGINLDLDTLSAMIEAAVYQEFNKGKTDPAPAQIEDAVG